MKPDLSTALGMAAGGALAAFAAFAVTPRGDATPSEGVAAPARPPVVRPAAEPPVPSLQATLVKLERRGHASPPADLFAARSWQPPPPPPPPPVVAAPPPPPPVPQAPALPFTLIGKFEEAPERTVYFLKKGEQLHTVKVGDVIENTYRLEQAGGGHLTLLYLPLNQKQLLADGQP